MGTRENKEKLTKEKNDLIMEQGKVSIDILKPILEDIKKDNNNSELLQSPEIGVDCAVLNFGEEYILVSSDPITGATSNIGDLVVDVNANDIYASNGEPVGIVLTVLLPENTTQGELKKIMTDIQQRCKSMNISIVGGHTEVTDAVTRPVVSATILGKTRNRKLLKKQNIEELLIKSSNKELDIVLTKDIALEGTNIIACDFVDNIKESLTNIELEYAQGLNHFLSIKEDCRIAFEHSENIYLHDVTEGGVFGGLYEMFEHLDLGFEVYKEKINILEVTKKLCNVLNINPYRLISSGSLLIVCENGKELVEKYKKSEIKSEVIGKVTKNKTKYIVDNGLFEVLEQPNGDDLFRIEV